MTTIMRVLPDAPSINPSGTAKTLFSMLKNANVHDMTWEGMLASLPKKVITKLGEHMQLKELDKALAEAQKRAPLLILCVNRPKKL